MSSLAARSGGRPRSSSRLEEPDRQSALEVFGDRFAEQVEEERRQVEHRDVAALGLPADSGAGGDHHAFGVVVTGNRLAIKDIGELELLGAGHDDRVGRKLIQEMASGQHRQKGVGGILLGHRQVHQPLRPARVGLFRPYGHVERSR